MIRDMAWSGIGLGFMALMAWVAAVPLPGLDWLVLTALAGGAALSGLAARRRQRLGVIGLGVNGIGLILVIVLSIT
jgi:hypothetical protein